MKFLPNFIQIKISLDSGIKLIIINYNNIQNDFSITDHGCSTKKGNMKIILVFLIALVSSVTTANAFEPTWGNVLHIFWQDTELKDSWFSAWSPDGSTLALGIGLGIFSVSMDGGNATRIFPNKESSPPILYNLDNSPNGKKIVFSFEPLFAEPLTSESTFSRIGIVDIATGAFDRLLIPPLNCGYKWPRWSPSGKFLCYAQTKFRIFEHSTEPLESSIIIYDTVTQSERTLITKQWTDGLITYPQFFPDGNFILYSFKSNIDNMYSLYTISVNGGEPQKITVKDENGNVLNCQLPSIHPDGIHCVVTGLGDTEYMSWVNMQTGKSIRLTPLLKEYSVMAPRLSPDGKRISYCRLPKIVHKPDPYPNETFILEIDNSVLKDEANITLAEADNPIPFQILSNYPNPFNASTTISYSIPKTGQADLSIYNAMGQQVRTLVNELVPAGRHETVWDGRDDAGNAVANGLYFSRLQAGEMVKTNKMLLMK